jgi:predicted transglutaminase-like cysteine proteinase
MMSVRLFGLVLCVLATTQAAVVHANPINRTQGQDSRSSMMRMYGPTDPPYAFWGFCERTPSECANKRSVDARFDADIEQLKALDDINRMVNRAIAPVTDMELYGVSDYWTLPRHGQGDCEDYALLKRRLLMDAGWPASALLITVVRDEKFEGHAILTARTGKGDLILDNKIDDIHVWNQTNYRYVMRQSYLDPRAWVALDPSQSAPTASMAVATRGQ